MCDRITHTSTDINSSIIEATHTKEYLSKEVVDNAGAVLVDTRKRF